MKCAKGRLNQQTGSWDWKQPSSTWARGRLEGLEGGSALLRTQQHWPPRPEKRIYWWNWNTRRNWTAESLKSSWEKKGGWIFCSDTQELWRSTPERVQAPYFESVSVIVFYYLTTVTAAAMWLIVLLICFLLLMWERAYWFTLWIKCCQH